MFFRRYQRTKQGKTHTYFALVESIRTDAGPRQHVIAHLGDSITIRSDAGNAPSFFNNRQAMRNNSVSLLKTSTSLARRSRHRRVRLDGVMWTNARRFGDVWLARWLWQFLGLDDIIQRHMPQAKRPCDRPTWWLSKSSIASVSRKASSRWPSTGISPTALEDLLGVPDAAVTKDRLYHTLDQLLKAKRHRERFERSARHSLSTRLQHPPVRSHQYYFEGLAEGNELAQRGYSRDHRKDCKQVVIALVVSRKVVPLAHHTWAGTTPKTSRPSKQ